MSHTHAHASQWPMHVSRLVDHPVFKTNLKVTGFTLLSTLLTCLKIVKPVTLLSTLDCMEHRYTPGVVWAEYSTFYIPIENISRSTWSMTAMFTLVVPDRFQNSRRRGILDIRHQHTNRPGRFFTMVVCMGKYVPVRNIIQHW